MMNIEKIRQIIMQDDEKLVDLLDNPVEFFSCDECANENKPKNDYDPCCPDCRDWIKCWLYMEEATKDV